MFKLYKFRGAEEEEEEEKEKNKKGFSRSKTMSLTK